MGPRLPTSGCRSSPGRLVMGRRRLPNRDSWRMFQRSGYYRRLAMGDREDWRVLSSCSRSRSTRRLRVVVVGSGSLACSFACSVAQVCRQAADVWVLARSAAATAQVAYLATATARLSRSAATFHAAPVDLGRGEGVERRLRDIQPELVLLCASQHSPWES